MSRKIVVAGAGQAAAAFAAKLRQLDEDCAITLIGEEPVLPYQRPPLSKSYMTGEMTLDRLLLRPEQWYADNSITCMTGETITGIDRQQKTVATANGETLAYDKLLLATGSTPRHLPAEIGGDLAGVHVLRSVADADTMAPEMVAGRTMLVVGGGYIGLEAAAVASSKGLKVYLIELADRILQRVACPPTSDFFRDLHTGNGVEIMENTALSHLEGNGGRVARAVLKDGQALDIDFVLAGIGVMPNTALAADTGIEVENGISVDSATRTSDPDIHAAGDCASFEFRGRRTRLESVQNAIDQAEAAARIIAGEEIDYVPVPWFWSDQFETKLQIAGLNTGYDSTVIRPGARPGAQSVWYFAGDEFLAVDAMNDPRTYMAAKRMLESGRSITTEQASDPQFDLKQLMK